MKRQSQRCEKFVAWARQDAGSTAPLRSLADVQHLALRLAEDPSFTSYFGKPYLDLSPNELELIWRFAAEPCAGRLGSPLEWIQAIFRSDSRVPLNAIDMRRELAKIRQAKGLPASAQPPRPAAPPNRGDTRVSKAGTSATIADLQRAAVEVPLLGVKVARVEFSEDPTSPDLRLRERRSRLMIVAVMEDGPGYHSGLVPGDVIENFGRLAGLPPEVFARSVSSSYRLGATFSIDIFFNTPGTQAATAMPVNVYLDNGATGRWITDVPDHGSGRKTLTRVSKDQLHGEYQKLLTDARATASLKACGYTPEDAAIITAKLRTHALRAGLSDHDEASTLLAIAKARCENAKTGGLARMEAAVATILIRKLSPCAFQPSADYRTLLDDDPAYAPLATVSSYDSGAMPSRLRAYVDRVASPEQRACFLKLIAAELTGKPFTPPRQAPAAPESRLNGALLGPSGESYAATCFGSFDGGAHEERRCELDLRPGPPTIGCKATHHVVTRYSLGGSFSFALNLNGREFTAFSCSDEVRRVSGAGSADQSGILGTVTTEYGPIYPDRAVRGKKLVVTFTTQTGAKR